VSSADVGNSGRVQPEARGALTASALRVGSRAAGVRSSVDAATHRIGDVLDGCARHAVSVACGPESVIARRASTVGGGTRCVDLNTYGLTTSAVGVSSALGDRRTHAGSVRIGYTSIGHWRSNFFVEKPNSAFARATVSHGVHEVRACNDPARCLAVFNWSTSRAVSRVLAERTNSANGARSIVGGRRGGGSRTGGGAIGLVTADGMCNTSISSDETIWADFVKSISAGSRGND